MKLNLFSSVVFAVIFSTSAIALAQTSDSSSSVVSLAARGEIAQLKAVLASGGSAKAVDEKGIPALYYAVRFNHADAAALLLDNGAAGINELYEFASGNRKDKLGFLSYASANKNKEMITTLLRYGANVNLLDESGDSALPLAIAAGDAEIVRLLLKAGIDPNRRLKTGTSALVLSLLNNNLSVMESLLDFRANIDLRDDYGSTPLMLAVEAGNVEAVRLLLNRGAKIYPVDAFGQSALGIAGTIQNFIEREQIVSLLRAAGAKEGSSLRPIDVEFLTAVRQGDLQRVTSLLNKGADLHARGRLGDIRIATNALELSVKHPKVCSFLLDKGINVFMKSSYDFTALHAAASEGEPQVIAMLVAKGLDPNARSRSGMSPMYQAINGNPKVAVVEALIKAGADPDGPTPTTGKSIIQFARSMPNKRIVEMLEAAKAK